MNYSKTFQEIYNELQRVEDIGQVANYIPELAHVNPNQFGVHLITVNGEYFDLGDDDVKF